jgi:hypothetical protein
MLIKKTSQMYVLPPLAKCHSAIATFDLWTSKETYDVFALVFNFWAMIGNQSM